MKSLNNRLPIAQYMEQFMEQIKEQLPFVLPIDWNIPSELRECMYYSLLAGGKRMRPLLVIAATECFGASREPAWPVACAVEMVHTYSLIHDDLPMLDNDDYRRGKLTNHKVFGEALALLAGDAWLTHAFYTIVQSHRQFSVCASATLFIVEQLAQLAGAAGMVGGQVTDVQSEQGVTTEQQLREMHLHKTADLIVFSLLSGAKIGGCTSEQMESLRQFGRHLGLAFQIQDDILDVVGEKQKLGKNTKSDLTNHKVTYPYVIGMDAAKLEVKRLTTEAKQSLEQSTIPDVSRLLEISDYLMDREC